MPDDPLGRVRRYCTALPDTSERLSHGEPTFFVHGKVFVMFANNHHGDGHIAVYLPVPPGIQAALIEQAPATFFKPPYVGVRGWVGIELDRIGDEDLNFYVYLAWELIAPKRLLEFSMAQTRDWQGMKTMSARLLQERTGQDVDTWNRRIRKEPIHDELQLRAWLAEHGVTGYAQSLLVWERFGYPDFLLATADELIQGQYADRPQLRPIFDAIIAAAAGLGAVTIQTRKTYVSLVSPRRTFARVQPTTKNRVDLGLRLERQKPGGHLEPSEIHETMPLQISFTSREEVDSEVLDWLQQAYDENC